MPERLKCSPRTCVETRSPEYENPRLGEPSQLATQTLRLTFPSPRLVNAAVGSRRSPSGAAIVEINKVNSLSGLRFLPVIDAGDRIPPTSTHIVEYVKYIQQIKQFELLTRWLSTGLALLKTHQLRITALTYSRGVCCLQRDGRNPPKKGRILGFGVIVPLAPYAELPSRCDGGLRV